MNLLFNRYEGRGPPGNHGSGESASTALIDPDGTVDADHVLQQFGKILVQRKSGEKTRPQASQVDAGVDSKLIVRPILERAIFF